MKKIITILACAVLLTGCSKNNEANIEHSEEPEKTQETAAATTTLKPKPTPTPKPKATATPNPEPAKTAESIKAATPAPTVKPAPVQQAPAQEEKQVYEEPVQEYAEPLWEEPVYYEEPVQEVQSYNDGSVASMFNGQYPGTSCEGVAGLYLGGDMSYLLASYGYQVWDPVPGDVIAYFDSGWNYRHTAVFLGNGQALHGSYNADKSAQVASMYIGGYPNLCYYRVGGDTCYTQFLNDIAHANGGRAGWLEGITFPLG